MRTKDETPNVVGNIAIIFASVLMIALGSIMLLTDGVKLIYFCYGAGGCLLVWGIWLISRYFLHKEFQQTTNYGFSVGTLVVILGAIDLIRAQDVANSIPTYLGILVLVEGVVMLQNTVQLKNLKGNLWTLSLLFSILSVVASVVILLDIKHIISGHMAVLYVIQIVVGAFALLSLCFVGIRTKRFHRDAAMGMKRNLEESSQWFSEDTGKDEDATEDIDNQEPVVEDVASSEEE
ncbi:MAG: DUF308 domain-containing protein [Lachnospiraceae bacterium]|nr:DUF308 domain-containing protein [Lachnospiraceae bacterium]